MTLPTGWTLNFGYYFGSSKEALEQDQNGAYTYFHFLDSLDRPTTMYLPIGWTLNKYTSPTLLDSYAGITDTTPSTSCVGCRHDQTTLDTLARPVTKTLANDPDGADTLFSVNHDSSGRVVTVSYPYRGSPTNSDSFSYDGVNRVIQVTHSDSQAKHTYYGVAVTSPGAGGIGTRLCSTSTYGFGFPVLSVDEAGKKGQIWLDGFGRIIEADEPDGSGNLTVATCYSYDVVDNLTTVSQGTLPPRTYTYDALSRLVSVQIPETGTKGTTFSYTNSLGQPCSPSANAMCSRTDARGITTTYTYQDSLGRLTQKSYSGPTMTANVSYTYDQGTNALGQTQKGFLTGISESDGSSSASWTNDLMGRVLTEQRTISGVTKTLTYAYNLDGSVASVTYPSMRVVTYSYGGAGRALSAVDTANSINYALRASYAPQGALAGVTLGQTSLAKTVLSQAFNARLQPLQMIATSWQCHIQPFSPVSPGVDAPPPQGCGLNGVWVTSNVLYLHYSFGTTDNGSVTSITNYVNTARTQNFAYDPLNRILTAQTTGTSGAAGCWGEKFGDGTSLADDRYANLTTIAPTLSGCAGGNLSVTASNNQLVGSPMAYDPNSGNMTTDNQGFGYTYDAENRITQASGMSGGPYTYAYDESGLRVQKKSASATGTLYWRSIFGDTIAESDLSGNITNEYVFFAGRRIARRDASGNGYYYAVDALGTTRTITNAGATVCYDADFDPYGVEIYTRVNSCPQNYKFTGYERDSETGLDYAFARYYSSLLGRFMSPDPVGGAARAPQSVNRYAYVVNNPVNLVDPVGLDPDFTFVLPYWSDFYNGDFFGGSGDFGDFSGAGGFGGAPPLLQLLWTPNGYLIPMAPPPPHQPPAFSPPPPSFNSDDRLPNFAVGVLSQVRHTLYPLAEPQTLRTCGVGGFLFYGLKGQVAAAKGELLGVYNYDSQQGGSLGVIAETQLGGPHSPVSAGGEASFSLRDKKLTFEPIGFFGGERKVRPGLFGAKTFGLSGFVAGAGVLATPSGQVGGYVHVGPFGGGSYAGICAAPDPNP